MQKVDVAISSYRKPESLIYAIFSLKKYCGDLIDTIYIDDNGSNDNTLDYYLDKKLHDAVFPIKIYARANKKRTGFARTIFTRKFKIKNLKQSILYAKKFLKNDFYDENDILFQRALNLSDKKYVFVMHDDIKFFDNIIKLYIETMEKTKNCAIVGDLGQCWRCKEADKCSPEFIMQGNRPSKHWPLTTVSKGKLPKHYGRDCRINEWCCLISVDIARKLTKESCHFGNFEDGGDIGAFWFAQIIKKGYAFSDPLPFCDERKKYYLHAWQGHSGHSVWVDQGSGIFPYKKEMIRNLLKEEFNYEMD